MPYFRRSVAVLHPKVKPSFAAVGVSATALVATYAATHKVDSAELGALIAATFAAVSGYIVPSGTPYAAPVAEALVAAEKVADESAGILLHTTPPTAGPDQL